MDIEWASARLTAYLDAVRSYQQQLDTVGFNRALYERAVPLEPTAKKIMRAVDADFEDYKLNYSGGDGKAVDSVLHALAILKDQEEVALNLGPATPGGPLMAAEGLHSWVWDAAKTFWLAGHHREAASSALRAINSHTQAKSGRRDLTDARLASELLSSDKPSAGKPRLRLPGDPSTETWKSRMNGLRGMAQGCYCGIRNPAAHEHEIEWTEPEALEYLACASVLARWLDECQVDYETPQ
jgi:hypothetical protein